MARPKGGRPALASTTICWDCSRACGADMCSWAKSGKPVDGWDAEYDPVNMSWYGPTESYKVHSCPLFKPGKAPLDPASMDTDGCYDLLSAVVILAKRDYIKNPKSRRFTRELLKRHPDVLKDLDSIVERRKKKKMPDKEELERLLEMGEELPFSEPPERSEDDDGEKLSTTMLHPVRNRAGHR